MLLNGGWQRNRPVLRRAPAALGPRGLYGSTVDCVLLGDPVLADRTMQRSAALALGGTVS
jgi:hypothetical protein